MRQPRATHRRVCPGPSPRKRFGQHFLEPAWADKVLRAIAPSATISFSKSARQGALTRPLAARPGTSSRSKSTATWRPRCATMVPPNVTVVEGDFLEITPATVRDDARRDWRAGAVGLKVAGNLPYNIASPILFKSARAVPRRHADCSTRLIMAAAGGGRSHLARPADARYGVLERAAAARGRPSTRCWRCRRARSGRSRRCGRRWSGCAFIRRLPTVRDERAFQGAGAARCSPGAGKRSRTRLTAVRGAVPFSAVDVLATGGDRPAPAARDARAWRIRPAVGHDWLAGSAGNRLVQAGRSSCDSIHAAKLLR